jgi:ligand-binding sensor domain-containing protein
VQGYLRDLGIKPDATGFEIYVDQKKELWVINSADVYCYDTKNRKLHYFISGNLLSGLYQSDFGNDGDNLYAVSLTGEILQLNKTTNNISKIELKGDVKVSVTNQRYRLYIDSRHCFWLFSRLNNVVYFKTEQMTAWERLYLNSSVQTQNNVLLDILEDANGNIWFGTDHCGLFIYNPADKSLINYINDYNLKSSLASNNVSCLYKDDKNIIWIGHNKKDCLSSTTVFII